MNSSESGDKNKIREFIKENRATNRKAKIHKPIRFVKVEPKVDGPIDFLRWEKRRKIKEVFKALGIRKHRGKN